MGARTLLAARVYLLGWLRGVERPGRRKVFGILLAFSGVLVLFTGVVAGQS